MIRPEIYTDYEWMLYDAVESKQILDYKLEFESNTITVKLGTPIEYINLNFIITKEGIKNECKSS